uniref:Cathepsin propeptide inhibitor domain-containing protein n=1 Tax=Glossina pallidipes TaxID=7398 RepID=A0A1A9Z6P2_GLOPL
MALSRTSYIKSILSLACILFMNTTNIKASTEYNRYLAHIFQKYGDGGTMTFESMAKIYAKAWEDLKKVEIIYEISRGIRPMLVESMGRKCQPVPRRILNIEY